MNDIEIAVALAPYPALAAMVLGMVLAIGCGCNKLWLSCLVSFGVAVCGAVVVLQAPDHIAFGQGEALLYRRLTSTLIMGSILLAALGGIHNLYASRNRRQTVAQRNLVEKVV